MKDNKQTLILSVTAVTILILATIGVTYAYFAAQIDSNAKVDIITETSNETEVIYEAGSDLELTNAEPGDKTEVIFSASLTASNKTDDTLSYGIDWIIDSNDFEYEPEFASDPQLVYSIYYSEDNVTWNTLKENQDCTTAKGTIHLAENQILTAAVNTTKTIYWKVVVEYKSYNYNQATNMSKSLTGYIDVTGLD